MTQKELVLAYMRENGSITPMEAFSDLGITKLATVVSDMIRHDGLSIRKEMVRAKNRYGRMVQFMSYSLEE